MSEVACYCKRCRKREHPYKAINGKVECGKGDIERVGNGVWAPGIYRNWPREGMTSWSHGIMGCVSGISWEIIRFIMKGPSCLFETRSFVCLGRVIHLAQNLAQPAPPIRVLSQIKRASFAEVNLCQWSASSRWPQYYPDQFLFLSNKSCLSSSRKLGSVGITLVPAQCLPGN